MGLSAGTRLGPYEVVAPLGAGGMGEVWKARDTRLDRDVAIKVLPEKFFEDKERRTRFEREAKTLAAVNHPSIAAVYSFEEISGRFLLVQELLEGESLRQALSKGALPLKKALDVAIQMAEGLAAAHGKGIVHRDVKPENVFLTKDGHSKLLDFGLARHDVTPHDPADTRSPTVDALSERGVVLGTVAYMSPEQARGEAVDFRSDQFSLGTVLYEMLTGKRPFVRDSAAETMTAIIRDEPEPVTKLAPMLPAPLGWIVQQSLSKDPEERYSSTKDLAKELQKLRTHLSEAVSAAQVGPVATPRLRRRVPVWVLAVAAFAGALVLFIGSRLLGPGPPAAQSLSLTLSFPVDAAPIIGINPLALSPDGKTLVYAAGRQLFARPLDRDEIRPIQGTEGGYLPFFSPDGREVGFFVFADHKLKKVPLAGGSPVTLCDAPNSRGGSWGADGTIVFVPAPGAGLQRIPASGGEPRTVLAADMEKGSRPAYPQILPDGESVLFVEIHGVHKTRAAVVSLRTGERKIVQEAADYPRYLPSGHLVFVREGILWAAPFSLNRLGTTGPPVPILEDVVTRRYGMAAANFAFSTDGTLVYVPLLQPRRTLVWVDRKGATERLPVPPGGYVEVALSPDAGHLAAISIGKAEGMSLLFGDLGRGTLTRSSAEGIFDSLAWAPDGRRVAIGFAPEDKYYGVFWQSVDGSTPPERLLGETESQQESPTSFSPDGNSLLVRLLNYAYTSPADIRWETAVLSLAGKRELRPFLKSKFHVTQARFSPDGHWVAFKSNESGRDEVYVQSYPPPGPRWQISTAGGEQPRWSRSGRELFYRQEDKVLAVDIEQKPTFRVGRPRVLFEGAFLDTDYDVSPNGTRFLMIKPDPEESGPAHVKVVLNWFEEVKRRVPGAR